MVRLLVGFGAKIDARNNDRATPLICVAAEQEDSGAIEVMRELLKLEAK